MSSPHATEPQSTTARAPQPNAGSKMVGRVLRLSMKELRETLRDRRTIATLVLMPLLIYPLLSIAFQRFLLANLRPPDQLVYRIGVASPEDEQTILRYLVVDENLLLRQQSEREERADRPDEDDTDGENSESAPRPEEAEGAQPDPSDTEQSRQEENRLPPFELVLLPNLELNVASARIDLGIRITGRHPAGRRSNLGDRIDCELIHNDASEISRQSLVYVERRLQAVNERSLSRRLRRMGVERRVLPVITERTSIEPTGAAVSFSLSTLVPLILILMTITGAVYPAIDLTAGERERGTLEILIAAPVPRLGLLLAKYVAVLTVALLTATVNLVSMTVVILSIGLGSLLFGDGGLSIGVIVAVFGLLILFAAFFSAVLLVLTSFARSFKEAQAYLVPLMLVSIAPGMLSMIPGLKLNGLLAAAPLVNIVLLARDLFEQRADPLAAGVVILTTILYALAAITAAGRIFGTDAMLFGSSGTWSDLFLRPSKPLSAPTITSAMLCLGVMFPAHFLLVHLMARYASASIERLLALQGVISLLLFAGIPLAAAAVNRVNVKKGFRLNSASPIAFAAAMLLGLSIWPFVFEIIVLAETLGLVSIGQKQLEWATGLLERLQGLSPALILLCLAVIPAMVEEFFFRGYLLSGLSARMSARRSILISALLFGAFHVIVKDSLALERLIPSTLVGVVLGWVCYSTGSLFPGIVLHACHNGSLMMIAFYREDLAARGWITASQQDHLPASWLIAAAVGVAAGFALMKYSQRGGEKEPSAENR